MRKKVSQKFSGRTTWLILGCDQQSCSAVIWTTCQLPVRQYFCFVCSGRSTNWSNGTTELVPSDGRELRPRVCWEGAWWLLLLLPGALSLQLNDVTWRGSTMRADTPSGTLRWKTLYKHTWCFKQMQNFLCCHCLAHRDIHLVLLSRVSAVLFRENFPDSEHRNNKVALHRHVSWDGDSGVCRWVSLGFGKY